MAMPYNSFLGKREIVKAMLDHSAVKVAVSKTLRFAGKRFGFLYIMLFGYPANAASRILAREVLKILNKDRKGLLLDVGCSHGSFDFELARRGYTVVGIDMNKESLAVGNKIRDSLRIKNVTFHHMDILSNDFPDKKFDSIIAFETLEHIKEDDRVIQEFALNPCGRRSRYRFCAL
jgi:2-polyprenyl-3-methyl-5-hydroxy-6-metoxy-1,4-benzoquinol methylase